MALRAVSRRQHIGRPEPRDGFRDHDNRRRIDELPGMKRIEAGSKEDSYLFHKLRGTHLDVGGSGLRMPRSGPPYLSDSDVDRIGAFIDGL